MMTKWTVADIPPQRGRSAVITGTGGLGYEDALALARAGAHVIVAGRNAERGAAALSRILRIVPAASVRFELVDLASLSSIEAFGARLRAQREHLDLLINNAAVMTPPNRQQTSDGFELQFGTNYLGHFALSAQLFPLLRKGKNPRVVTVSSIASRGGVINFDDLQAERSYKPMSVYSQSKLACLMFALELHRRSEGSNWGVSSLAAHPGISRTRPPSQRAWKVQHHGPGANVALVPFSTVSTRRVAHAFRGVVAEGDGGGLLRPGQDERDARFPHPGASPAAGE